MASYQVSARKYRPQTLDEIIGQDHIISSLKKMILQSKVPSSFLFSGFRGSGKTSLARILSKCLNCESGLTIKPCQSCAFCVEITRGSSRYVMEIDGASNRGIEEIKKIKENIQYLTGQNRYKVYIIDEVHMLTDQAFNALLKTLEEPPIHVIFIFATTEPHKVKLTIQSRCQHYFLKPISFDKMKIYLKERFKKENINMQEELLNEVIRKAKGSMRDLQNILDQVLIYCSDGELTIDRGREILASIDKKLLEDFLKAFFEKNIQKALMIVFKIVQEGLDHNDFIEKLIASFKILLFLKKFSLETLKNNQYLINLVDVSFKFYDQYKNYLKEADILKAIHIFLNTYDRSRKNFHLNFVLESLVFDLFNIQSMNSPDIILEDIKELKKSLLQDSDYNLRTLSKKDKIYSNFSIVDFLAFLKIEENSLYENLLKEKHINLNFDLKKDCFEVSFSQENEENFQETTNGLEKYIRKFFQDENLNIKIKNTY